MGHALNTVHAYSVSVFRGLRGLMARPGPGPGPKELLELYDFEACPYCRKVREVMSELDLEYLAKPCPKGSERREEAVALGGQLQFPFLVDPNTGESLYESEDIITYLIETYGRGSRGIGRFFAPLNTLTATLASAIRPRGRAVRPGRAPVDAGLKALVLYNMEASPYCRKVRETLCELNLEYRVRNVAKRSRRRPELVAEGGQMMVPYLSDPNTGTALYESEDIVAYLEKTYR